MQNEERFFAVPAERLKHIQQYIVDNGSATVAELSERFSVSEATVRRDLEEASLGGRIRRTHGGAISVAAGTSYERAHDEKLSLGSEEKRRIGEYAASLVQDADTVILDSGTTTFAMLSFLVNKRNITLITNDLYIANAALLHPTSSLMIAAGMRTEKTHVAVGCYCEDFLRGIRADIVFVTADAVDIKNGVTNANMLEVGTKRVMVNSAGKSVLLVDSSKFDKQAMLAVYPLSALSMIVTDSGIPPDCLKRYQKEVKLVVV